MDGEIESMRNATNMLGAEISFPMIRSVSVDVMSYIDAVTPTRATSTPESASIDQAGIVLTVDKVEFADDETRVYVTETNNSSASFSLCTYSAKAVQNGRQFDQDSSSMSSYEGDYPQLSSDLAAGATSSGIIVFPALESSSPLQLILEGYSDDMNVGNSASSATPSTFPPRAEVTRRSWRRHDRARRGLPSCPCLECH